jgi:c-di-GMP-binding flagellar brake protein YcgR
MLYKKRNRGKFALITVFILIFVFIAALVVILRLRGGKNKFPFFEFYSRGRKEGFSFRDISFLKQIAVQNRLSKPQSIYWSTRQLDRCLRPAFQKINADERMSPAHKMDITNKLLELRKKAEFNLPKYHKRIRETSAILPRQKLVIKDRQYGTFVSWVVENNRRYLVVTQPSGQKAAEMLSWIGRKVQVYFWRHDDAGYEFDTKVQEQIPHEEYPLLYLAHSQKLERKQKRQSVRVEVRINARFFPVIVSTGEGVRKPVISERGHMAKLIDLSESGCAMLAGKGLTKNARLKIDFNLTDSKRIVVLGVVVNISKTADERVSRYHIMFTRIGPQSKNNILLYVYNIFGEREEEGARRPVRKIAPEASAPPASAQAAPGDEDKGEAPAQAEAFSEQQD